MDLSMEELMASLSSVQATKSTTRLSDRNVVELVNKLKQLGILGDDLLYTMNGREYLTTARLRSEVETCLRRAGGRLALVELPALLGVDLVHCERQAKNLVQASKGDMIEAQGELITQMYFDGLAAEVNEMLQDSGMVSVADLALQYALATEMVLQAVQPRMGRIITGRLEGPLLYTPAYLRSVKARLRGALRGAAQPLVLSSLTKELALEGPLTSGPVLHELITDLVAEGALRGTLRGGGSTWTPSAHSEAQAGAVAAFYEQNGWVGFDTVKKLGFSDAKAYLSGKFTDGLALESMFVAPSLLGQVDAAAEEVISTGGWADLGPLLPPALSPGDVSALLAKAPSLAGCGAAAEAMAVPGGDVTPQARKTLLLLAGTCVVSAQLVVALKEAAAASARVAADKAIAERRAGGGPGGSAAAAADTSASSGGKGNSGGGGGKGGGWGAGDDDDDHWGKGGKGGGKKGGKGGGGKAGGGGGGKARAAAGGGAKGGKGGGGDAKARDVGLSTSQLLDLVLSAHPDMEGAGDDGSGLGGGGDAGDALPVAVATLLHPAAVMAYEEGLKAALNAGADARRRSKEAKEKAFEDALSRLALYCRGAEALEAGSDASTATAVLRHVTKTTGGECMDLIYRWAWIEYLPEDEMPAEGSPVSAADAKKVAKASPRDVAEALAAAADALASQEAGSVSDAVERAALGVGLRLRGKRDKAHTAKEVKAAVAELRTRLSLQLQAEAEPAAALALALPLLFARATGCALSAPGKAMAGVLAFVRAGGSVPEPELAVFEAFHAGVVDALKGGNGGDDLVARLPELRAAAAGTLGSSGGEGGEGGQEAGGV